MARWIERATGREQVHNQRSWDYLVRLGFSAQVPRPAHEGADEAAQAAFKNTLAADIAERRQERPVELWAIDEYRVGLKPILRRVWAKKGKRPRAHVRPRYE